MASPDTPGSGDRDFSAPDLLSILEGIADGVTAQDPSGQIIYANAAAAKLVGVAHARELVGMSAADLLHGFEMFDEQSNSLTLEALPGRRALAGETEPERLVRFRDVERGEDRWCIIKARPTLDAKGAVRFAINIWHDITPLMEQQRSVEETGRQLEEMAAELESTIDELNHRTELAEIRADRQRFLAEAGRLLSGSLDYEETLRMIVQLAVPRIADWAVISLADPDGRLRQLEVAHVDPEKVQFVLELQQKYPPDPSRDEGQYRVLRSGSSEFYPTIPPELLERSAVDAHHLELLRELKLRSGMIVPMQVQGRVLGVLTLIRAESNRNYHEEDLEFAESLAARAGLAVANAQLYRDAHEANRVKADFLAVMSHELRTPLTAIFGYTELLSTGVTGSVTDSQHTYLDRIHSSASHLLTIIEDILNYARAEAGKDQVAADRFALADVVRETVDMMKPAAEKKRIALTAEVGADVDMVSDRAKIRQILLNLLGNAVKFTEQGSVSLRATGLPEGWCELVVEDTGPGVPSADFDRIFEPFQQLEPSMTRTVGGTGLGLAVTRRFAELLGGSVEVGSAPTGGASFTVRIPAKVK